MPVIESSKAIERVRFSPLQLNFSRRISCLKVINHLIQRSRNAKPNILKKDMRNVACRKRRQSGALGQPRTRFPVAAKNLDLESGNALYVIYNHCISFLAQRLQINVAVR